MDIKKTIKEYLVSNNILEAQFVSDPEFDDKRLFSTATLDSIRTLELIFFLEKIFNLKFDDQDLLSENFDSMNRIKATIERCLEKRKEQQNELGRSVNEFKAAP